MIPLFEKKHTENMIYLTNTKLILNESPFFILIGNGTHELNYRNPGVVTSIKNFQLHNPENRNWCFKCS